MDNSREQEKKQQALEDEKVKTPDNRAASQSRWLVIPLVMILVGVGIFQYVKIGDKSQQLTDLQKQNQELIREKDQLQSYVSEVTVAVNEVSLKLRDIRQKQVDIQGIISAPETKTSQHERMLQDLQAIQSQLSRDKRNLEDLQDRMKDSKVRIASLEQMVSQLKDEIEQNRTIIAKLNETLREKEYVLREIRDTLNVSRRNLDSTKVALDESMETLEKERNTAFYISGEPNDLAQKNIIQRHGWIWWKYDVLTSRFNTADFNEIDISKQNSFVLDRKPGDVKVIPAREEDSYTIEDNGEETSVLKVIDRERFWKVPYLVMVLD